jgi:hypothetical protein
MDKVPPKLKNNTIAVTCLILPGSKNVRKCGALKNKLKMKRGKNWWREVERYEGVEICRVV